jgi:hypothetical protein
MGKRKNKKDFLLNMEIVINELEALKESINKDDVFEGFKNWLSQGRQITTVSFIYPFLYSESQQQWLTIDQANEILELIIESLNKKKGVEL